jgi:hypothetical protein
VTSPNHPVVVRIGVNPLGPKGFRVTMAAEEQVIKAAVIATCRKHGVIFILLFSLANVQALAPLGRG